MTLNEWSGLKKIGFGSTRNVYEITSSDIPNKFNPWICEDVVIKEAKRQRGIEENILEHRVWETGEFDFLCPILDIIDDGRYIIMNKAKTSDITDCQVEHILHKYSNKRKISIHSDIWKKNIGIYNNEPVLIDYPFLYKNYVL